MALPRRSADSSETNVHGAKFLIVEARFYDVIGAMLLEGAAALLRDCPCETGCPGCVGPIGEVGERGKETTGRILTELLAPRT